jgi:glycine C-acetyltransferase
MFSSMKSYLTKELDQIKGSGLFKDERIITSPQDAKIEVMGSQQVLNFCANNYLGLASHPEIIDAAQSSYEKWGYGLSSVRFICGTQEIHKELEKKISDFLGMEDTILYTSCFDANGGLFETLLSDEVAVISDELNHASIIDGIRLSKAQRYRVDDSHAVGFMGEKGRGTHEYNGVIDRVDIITGTLGKALGGASGGYTSGKKEIIDILRQRSRPYLFSNTVAPSIISASLKVIELLTKSDQLREKLHNNTKYFRHEMVNRGFNILPGTHPIVPIMLGDAVVAQDMASRMLDKGVYVIGFSFPVVPVGRARIRTQISAAHSMDDLKFAIEKFSEVKEAMNL